MRGLLELLLPAEDREAIAGDLEEDFTANVSKYGVRAARWRYLNQAVDAVVHTRAPELIATVAGLTGGGFLIWAEAWAKAPAMLLVWAALTIGVGAVGRAFRIRSFTRRFALIFTSFTLTALILFSALAAGLPLERQLISLAFVGGLALFFSALVAVLTSVRNFRAAAIALVPVLFQAGVWLARPQVVSPGLRIATRVVFPFSAFLTPMLPRFRGWFVLPDLLLWTALAIVVARRRSPSADGAV